MELVPILCNQCGASLQISAAANFVTCQHCQTQLAVKRNQSTAWTEQLQQIDRRTQQLAHQVAVLTYQNEIERIDREWLAERESYCWRGKDGSLVEPGIFVSIFHIALGCVFGLVVFNFVHLWSQPYYISATVLVVPCFVICFGVRGFVKLADLNSARDCYEARRRDLRVEDFHPDQQATGIDASSVPQS